MANLITERSMWIVSNAAIIAACAGMLVFAAVKAEEHYKRQALVNQEIVKW